MDNIGKTADAVSVASNGAPLVPNATQATVAATSEPTVEVATVAPPVARPDIVGEVSHVVGEVANVAEFIPGAASVVKILTAAQQLLLVIEEVKKELATTAPTLWAEIVSAFPSLEKKS